MPKARKHKKGTTKKRTHTQTSNHVGADSLSGNPVRGTGREVISRPSAPVTTAPAKPAKRAFGSPATRNAQSLVTPVIVALGCWGLAASFAFFYATDPNHLLYAAVAAAMALIWTIICANRAYKLYMLRQRA